MLRITLCAVLLQVGCGLGVDDTEKRRSEEILRAVAAAATADYEGLQQMKFQKTSTTRTLSAAASTKECVEKLQIALEAEEVGLNKEAKKAKGELEGHLSDTIGVEATEMKQALHNALIAVYTSLHDRYQQVQTHATAMMAALADEIEDGKGSTVTAEDVLKQIITKTAYQLAVEKNTDLTREHWDAPATCQLSLPITDPVARDFYRTSVCPACQVRPENGEDRACYCGIQDFEEGLDTSSYNAADLVHKHETTCLPVHWDTPGGFEFEDAVLSELTDMLLANAQAEAFANATDDDKDVTQTSLIALNTILSGPNLCVDHCEHRVVSQSGWGTNKTPYGAPQDWQFDLTRDDFYRKSFETRYECSCNLADWTATAEGYGADSVETCPIKWVLDWNGWPTPPEVDTQFLLNDDESLGYPKPRPEDYPNLGRPTRWKCNHEDGSSFRQGAAVWSIECGGGDDLKTEKVNATCAESCLPLSVDTTNEMPCDGERPVPTHCWTESGKACYDSRVMLAGKYWHPPHAKLETWQSRQSTLAMTCHLQANPRLAYEETREDTEKQCEVQDPSNGMNICQWNCVDAGGGYPSNKNREEWKGRIDFEDKQLSRVERAYIKYMKQKSLYHNHTTGHSALQSAKKMVIAKIDALVKSKEHIKVYEVELDTLQDDEMRRIADIKEEFESLAADWLQLATYHCCDIVQGNAVECEDATDHLMQPINNVFPNALKKPDPARDCTRRLL